MAAPRPIALLALCLAIVACGGSSVRPSTAAPSATPSRASTAAPATTSTASPPPEVPRRVARRHRPPVASAGLTRSVRFTVSVTIGLGGTGLPPSLGLPSGADLDMRTTNRGTATQLVVVEAPHRPSLRLRPGQTGDLRAAGLRDGTYPIEVDGAARSRIVVGAQGGP